jgi:hypothetical protein
LSQTEIRGVIIIFRVISAYCTFIFWTQWDFLVTFLMSHAQVPWKAFLASSNPNYAVINSNFILKIPR